SARERIWNTPNGKANFILQEGLMEDDFPTDRGILWMMSMRSHDQYNTTLYSISDRYRGVVNQREMHKRGLEFGDRVDVTTWSTDGNERCLRNLKLLPWNMPDGSCGTYYPEA